MTVQTLQCQMTSTVVVRNANVQLQSKTNRIGTGFEMATILPTGNLSLGHFSWPPYPESKPTDGSTGRVAGSRACSRLAAIEAAKRT